MLKDVSTILWKEWRELIQQRGGRSGLVNWLVMVALVGIFIPGQMGAPWLSRPLAPLSWMWPAILAVMWIMADSFSGERERHTLETLLASRMPDRAILFGKILAAVLYGWSIEVVALLVGAVTINVKAPGSGFYPLWAFFGLLGTCLAAVLLVCSLGAFMSLRSPTVRGAYQRLNITVLAMGLAIGLGFRLLPAAIRARVLGFFENGPVSLAAVAAVLAGCGLLVLALCLTRFHRNRLIVD